MIQISSKTKILQKNLVNFLTRFFFAVDRHQLNPNYALRVFNFPETQIY